MARWKLTDKHYIHIEGTEWEYRETDQATGRQGRKIFKVPRYLNPEDPSDHNYPGMIVVSLKPNGNDYVFEGGPTMDMEPLDDEAKALSAEFKKNYKHPMHEFDMNYGQTYSQSLLTDMQRQLSEATTAAKTAEARSLRDVSAEDFAKLKAQMDQLLEQNAKMQAQLAEKSTRRI